MGICAEELRAYVVAPCLEHLGEWSKAAENLLLGTAALESSMGFHLHNHGQRGVGLFQILPERHTEIWDHFLIGDADMASKVRGLASQREFLVHPHAELATNLSYATAIAWMIYKYNRITLPDASDTEGLAKAWIKGYHNGDAEETTSCHLFVNAYQRHVSSTASAA
ncbi:MAG: hypothetical protein AseanaTS_13610 [Candidatus Pelagadaptatus aseana]|uniref:hypothetical protein n=1 Tax=Candidatus Pelagadaptatus aseana TaxID=3120508 RepID=UPI0039B16E08